MRITRNWTDDDDDDDDVVANAPAGSSAVTPERHVYVREFRRDQRVIWPSPRVSERASVRMWKRKNKKTKRRERKKEKHKEKKKRSRAVEEEKRARERDRGARNTREHVCVNARGVFFAAASGE